jgi:hypothetical protein
MRWPEARCVRLERASPVWDGRGNDLKEVAVSRLSRLLTVALLALGVAAPSAGAIPDRKLGHTLGAMWKTILETPSPRNPFTPGVGPVCLDLGRTVAPFAARGEAITCTVKPGTKIFVAAWSSECSTIEAPPFFGGNPAELRACAIDVNAGVSVRVTLDGRQVATSEVTSGVERLDLPADNIFGAAPGTGPTPSGLPYLSVANGAVKLLHPLTPGRHTIKIAVTGESPPGTTLDIHNITTIIVKRR